MKEFFELEFSKRGCHYSQINSDCKPQNRLFYGDSNLILEDTTGTLVTCHDSSLKLLQFKPTKSKNSLLKLKLNNVKVMFIVRKKGRF